LPSASVSEVLSILDKHLEEQPFLAAGRYTIADIAVYAYSHLARDVGIDIDGYPSFRRWLDRVEAQPRFIDDLEPYPPNASVLAGKSIYG
jgi:glutathione S-transferase